MSRYRRTEIPEPTTQRLFKDHNGWIWTLALSPDEKTLAGGGNGVDPRIHLWDVQTGEALGVLQGHLDAIPGLAFSLDGKRLYSTSHDGTLREWDVVVRAQVGEPRVSVSGWLLCLAISPDGTLAVGGGNRTLFILPPGGAQPQQLQEQPNGILLQQDHQAFSLDGNTLAAGMAGGHLSLFQRTGGSWQQERTWRMDGGTVWSLAFTPDQQRLVSGRSEGYVWEVALHDKESTPKQLPHVEAHLRGQVRSLLFADESTLLAVQRNLALNDGRQGSGRLALVSWPDGKLLREFNDFYGTPDSLILCSKGRQLLVSKNRTPGLGDPDRLAPSLLDFGDVHLGRGEQPFFKNAPWLQV